jgi:hypothetical protein
LAGSDEARLLILKGGGLTPMTRIRIMVSPFGFQPNINGRIQYILVHILTGLSKAYLQLAFLFVRQGSRFAALSPTCHQVFTTGVNGYNTRCGSRQRTLY